MATQPPTQFTPSAIFFFNKLGFMVFLSSSDSRRGSTPRSMNLVLLCQSLLQLGDIEARRARHLQDHGLLAGEQIAGGGNLGRQRLGDGDGAVPVGMYDV